MISRFEPERFDSSTVQKYFLEILEKNQWISFFEKIDGYCEKVGLEFAYSFDGERDTIGNFTIRLSEDIAAKITGLPQQGERYFKTKQLKDNSWAPFISRSMTTSVDWKKGIPRIWLIHPWDEIAYIIHKFVTCEGRFNIIYLYHIKLMYHLRKIVRSIRLTFFCKSF